MQDQTEFNFYIGRVAQRALPTGPGVSRDRARNSVADCREYAHGFQIERK